MSRLAVIGHPVAHSRSPAMQRAALVELGLDDWSYEAIDVVAEEFASRVRGLASDGFVGVNVTIPHKEAALAIADEASLAASQIGAANTLTFVDGTIIAENTDAPGLLAALPESPRGRRALVLGAGGAARAAVWALVRNDAHVRIWNRTHDRAEELAREFGVAAVGSIWPEIAGEHLLLVNATAVGLDRKESQLVGLGLAPHDLRGDMLVVDLLYGERETELVHAARAAGANAVDGLEVLARQGAVSLRIWTGLEAPVEVMRAAARQPDATLGRPA